MPLPFQAPLISEQGKSDLDPHIAATLRTFVQEHWEETLRVHREDEGDIIGLPCPYVVPCRKGRFQELYYWDTYFACLGLIESGRTDLAIFNLRNFLHLVKRFGFIPNGSRTFYLNRSQPPYLAALVQRIGAKELGPELMAEAVSALKDEYNFWLNHRNSPTGLAHYGNHATEEQLKQFFTQIQHRANLKGQTEEKQLWESSHTLAEAESGWDFTPRFEHRCGDCCAVDLNSNLFLYENLLAEVSIGSEREKWEKRAMDRQQRITSYCWNQKGGAFFDYDFLNGRQNQMLAVSTFHPLWAGLATPEQAALIREKALPELELEFGVVPCKPGPRDAISQWDAPNIWPCLQAIVYRGLARYGYQEDAERIARKYVNVVWRGFQETGDLWEKYNAENGSTKTKAEANYITPAMMGWTAGVLMDALRFLESPEA
ncbi:MAG: trehalase family glycosidase [Chthoniobacteraceae bacterium]